MMTTRQAPQTDLPAAGESSHEWHNTHNGEQNNHHSPSPRPDAPHRFLNIRPDEEAGDVTETEPDRSQTEPAKETGEDEDLLIIPLRPAERRAEDFLPGWVRRFSRA